MHGLDLFEAILNTNIVNFLIVVWILRLIFKKANLGDIIDKMSEDIKLSVEKSDANIKKAEEEYRKTEDFVKDTADIQKQIKKQAKLSMTNIAKKIEEKTVVQQNELKMNLHKIFDSQNKEYKYLTYKNVFETSINLAKEEILKRLDNDMHKKLINSSIDELDKIEGSLS